MTTSRSEEVLVGIVALALVPWVVWTVVRALRNERVPIGRDYVTRDRPGPFAVLLASYIVAGLLVTAISLDRLLNVKLWKLL